MSNIFKPWRPLLQWRTAGAAINRQRQPVKYIRYLEDIQHSADVPTYAAVVSQKSLHEIHVQCLM